MAKETSLLKLKKEYKLYLTSYVETDRTTLCKFISDNLFYSKVYLIPFQTLPSNVRIKVPLELMKTLYIKRRITLVYKVSTIDHKERKIYADLVGLELTKVLNQPSTFDFNRSLNFEINNLKVKCKILLNKKVDHKTCSKAIQKNLVLEVKKILLKDLEAKSLDQLILDILNKTIQKKIIQTLPMYNEYFKTIIVTSIE